MTPEKFIDNVKESIDSLNELYSQGRNGPTYLGSKLDDIGLTTDQRKKVLDLIELAVGEATHNIICGIEGSVSLGSDQQIYKLLDENNNEITGELDSLLYEKLEG